MDTYPRMPGEKISFSTREFSIPQIGCLLDYIPSNQNASIAFILDTENRLWRYDQVTQQSTLITTLSEGLLGKPKAIAWKLSDDDEFLSLVNWEMNQHCFGVVISTLTGECILELQQHHRMEYADYPVEFVSCDDKRLLIFASDWNQLDIMDLDSREILTSRNPEDSPELDEDGLYTEWAGTIMVSPQATRLATIGWVWHPFGVAYSWRLQDWLNDCWESDIGPSKVMYYGWEYLWHSSFCWLDEKRLCIWGAENPEAELEEEDMVTVYDADTGELLNSFSGPTMSTFIYDGFLFSGKKEAGKLTDALTVWDVNSGTLLHTEDGLMPVAYHRPSREFVQLLGDNRVRLWRWQQGAESSLNQ